MKAVLGLLQIHFPSFIKKKKLERLWSITAKAFGCEAPPSQGMTFADSLQNYAIFTRDQAEKQLHDPVAVDRIKEKLFLGAYELGEELRREFGITNTREVLQMSRIVYKILGIDFKSNSRQQVIIERCFFSQYYSAEICGLISSLDEGMAAGLSAGGTLGFYQRITEGYDCCRAHFVAKEVSK